MTNQYSDKQFKYRFNIGVVGYLEEKADHSEVYKIIEKSILSHIEYYVKKFEEDNFNVTSDKLSFDFYTSPLIADSFFVDCYQNWGRGDMCIIAPKTFEEQNTEEILKFYSPEIYKTIIPDLNVKKSGMNSLITWTVNQSDIGLIIWNGTEKNDEGKVRNFINQCIFNKIPCIWLDINNNENNIYWFESGFPEKYSEEKLKNFIENLFPNIKEEEKRNNIDLKIPFLFSYKESIIDGEKSKIPFRQDFNPKKFPFYKILEKFSKSFEKKHDVAPKYHKDIDENILNLTVYEKLKKDSEKNEFQSKILDETYSLEIDSADSEVIGKNHSALCECFNYYSKYGDLYNDVHRSFSLFRAYSPFLATFFLAFGFYASALFGVPFGDVTFSFVGFKVSLWSVISGLGFFASAVSILILKKADNAINLNKKKFLFFRYVSEHIRVLIFNYSYGIPFSTRFLNKDIKSLNETESAVSAKILRRALRRKNPANYNMNPENILLIIKHLRNYIIEQKNYQKGRLSRFSRIRKKLKTSLARFMVIQMGILAFRGLFQLFIGITKIYIGFSADTLTFILSLVNCLTLIIPAIYDLKERMKNRCLFDDNYNIADKVLVNLEILEKKFNDAYERKNISYEELTMLIDDTIDKILEEQKAWRNSINHS